METIKTNPVLTREHFEEIISSDVTIGLPMTPARWTCSKAKIIPALRLTVSCGGGLGGSKWDEIIHDRSMIAFSNPETRFLECVRINGETFWLNVNNVVQVESVNVVEVTYDSENKNFALGEWTERYLTRPGVKVTLLKGENDG